ncbi:MAG: ImmA/IrrE family metallo-endopeptidase [Mycobacterium sp.]
MATLVVDAAREAAEQVLASYWHLGKFPVDVEVIAEKMGLRIERELLRDGVAGMIRVRPGTRPTIYVNAEDNSARQRFMIAHEIGHFVERSNQGQDNFAFIDGRDTEYDVHEFYADEFARNLLMPADEIARLRDEGYTNVQMAAPFGVSVPALNERLGVQQEIRELRR